MSKQRDLRSWWIVYVTCIGLLIVLTAYASASYAQSPTILVRSCMTKPATDGAAACASSTWERPQDAIYVDVLRSNVTTDVWLKPSELIASDRVYACAAAVPQGSPSGSGCIVNGVKQPLPNQTNNWLASTSVQWTSVTPTPPSSITFTWDVPTKMTGGSDIVPGIDLVGYHVAVRKQTCDLIGGAAGCTAAGYDIQTDTTVNEFTVTGPAYEVCIIVQGRTVTNVYGVTSTPYCTTQLAPTAPDRGVPMAPTNLRIKVTP